jgi:hypothetical protein
VTDPIKYPITIHRDGKSYIAHVELTPELARQILGDLPARVGALETQHAWLMQHAVVGGSDGRDAERPAQPQGEVEYIDPLKATMEQWGNASADALGIDRLTYWQGRASVSEGHERRLRADNDRLAAQVKELEARLADRPKVKLPEMIPAVTRDAWVHTFSQEGHENYFRRKREEVIKAIRAAGIEVES